MFTINGTWEGKKTSIKWISGAVVGPDTFVDAIEKMTTTFTPGPVPLSFDHPDITNPDMAATMIEFTLDTVTSSDGPEVDLSGEFYEGVDIAKHPGPRGSALHSTGTKQTVHGHAGSRIGPLPDQLLGLELTMDALPESVQKKVIAQWEMVTGESRQRIVNQYRRLLRNAQGDPRYEDWRDWYADVHDLASIEAERNGISTENACAIFAALSPGMVWEKNSQIAVQLMDMVGADVAVNENMVEELDRKLFKDSKSGIYPDSPLHIPVGTKLSEIDNPRAASLMLQTVATEKGYGWPARFGYGPYQDAILLAYNVATPHEVLRGAKTRSFFNNILTPEGGFDVTIDFQMMEAAARRPLNKKTEAEGGFPSHDGKVRKEENAMTTTPKHENTAVGVRPYLADITRQVAGEFDLLPVQAQAVIWNQWKEEK